MQKKNRSTLRLLSLIVVQAFALEQVAFAAPDAGTFLPFGSQKPEFEFELPYSVAFIDDFYKGSDTTKSVVLIQDAHTNESGQLNIALALESILGADKIRLVFLEAGDGDVSLSGLRAEAPVERRKSVGLSYLRKGLLQGSEYLNLTSDLDFTLWGVEDQDLYKQAVETYRHIVDKREPFRRYLAEVKTTLDVLKPKVFNPSLKSFEASYSKFKKGEIAMTQYFAEMAKEAEKKKISLDSFPHLKALDEVRRKEEKIDFKKATEEQKQAVRTLSELDQKILHKAAQEDNGPSKLASTDPKEKKAFYALLEEKVKNLSDFPELAKYLAYLKSAQQIDARAILKEQVSLEEGLFNILIQSEDERRLFDAQNALYQLESIFNLTVTPDEFSKFKQSPLSYDIVLITGFLNKKIADLKQYFEKAVILEPGFEDALAAAEQFYELTYERDRAFLNNMFEKMAVEGQTKAVLITGGYHTPNLKELLKAQGVSFVTVTPQIMHSTDQKRYEKILLGQRLDGGKFDVAGNRAARTEATTVSTHPIRMRDDYPKFRGDVVQGGPASGAALGEGPGGRPEFHQMSFPSKVQNAWTRTKGRVEKETPQASGVWKMLRAAFLSAALLASGAAGVSGSEEWFDNPAHPNHPNNFSNPNNPNSPYSPLNPLNPSNPNNSLYGQKPAASSGVDGLTEAERIENRNVAKTMLFVLGGGMAAAAGIYVYASARRKRSGQVDMLDYPYGSRADLRRQIIEAVRKAEERRVQLIQDFKQAKDYLTAAGRQDDKVRMTTSAAIAAIDRINVDANYWQSYPDHSQLRAQAAIGTLISGLVGPVLAHASKPVVGEALQNAINQLRRAQAMGGEVTLRNSGSRAMTATEGAVGHLQIIANVFVDDKPETAEKIQALQAKMERVRRDLEALNADKKNAVLFEQIRTLLGEAQLDAEELRQPKYKLNDELGDEHLRLALEFVDEAAFAAGSRTQRARDGVEPLTVPTALDEATALLETVEGAFVADAALKKEIAEFTAQLQGLRRNYNLFRGFKTNELLGELRNGLRAAKTKIQVFQGRTEFAPGGRHLQYLQQAESALDAAIKSARILRADPPQYIPDVEAFFDEFESDIYAGSRAPEDVVAEMNGASLGVQSVIMSTTDVQSRQELSKLADKIAEAVQSAQAWNVDPANPELRLATARKIEEAAGRMNEIVRADKTDDRLNEKLSRTQQWLTRGVVRITADAIEAFDAAKKDKDILRQDPLGSRAERLGASIEDALASARSARANAVAAGDSADEAAADAVVQRLEALKSDIAAWKSSQDKILETKIRMGVTSAQMKIFDLVDLELGTVSGTVSYELTQSASALAAASEAAYETQSVEGVEAAVGARYATYDDLDAAWNLSGGNFTAEDRAVLRKLYGVNQADLFDVVPSNDPAAQRAFLNSALKFDEELKAKYGGIDGYWRKADEEVKKIDAGADPLAGVTISRPDVQDLIGRYDQIEALQNEAMQHADKLAIVLVAGGLGKRAQEDATKDEVDSKVQIPVSQLTGETHLQVYSEWVRRLEQDLQARVGKARIPFFTMSSDETDTAIVRMYRENDYYGLNGPADPNAAPRPGTGSQVSIKPQPSVPAFVPETMNFVIDPKTFEITGEPGGHGAIHGVIRDSRSEDNLTSLMSQWKAEGRTVMFIQDGNPLSINSLKVLLASMKRDAAQVGFAATKLAPGERSGIVTKWDFESGDSTQAVIEYSDAVRVAQNKGVQVSEFGDTANSNIFGADAGFLQDQYVGSAGGVTDFVNISKGKKVATRIESMMQSIAERARRVIALVLSKTNVYQRWSNNLSNAAAAREKMDDRTAAVYSDSRHTSESALYRYGREILNFIGKDVAVDGDIVTFGDVTYEKVTGKDAAGKDIKETRTGKLVYEGGAMTPVYAWFDSISEAREKAKGRLSVAPTAAFFPKGEVFLAENSDISIEGTLIVKAGDNVKITLEGEHVYKNGKPSYVRLTPAELADRSTPVHQRVDGRKLVFDAPETVIAEAGDFMVTGRRVTIDITAPGDYVVTKTGDAINVSTRQELDFGASPMPEVSAGSRPAGPRYPNLRDIRDGLIQTLAAQMQDAPRKIDVTLWFDETNKTYMNLTIPSKNDADAKEALRAAVVAFMDRVLDKLLARRVADGTVFALGTESDSTVVIGPTGARVQVTFKARTVTQAKEQVAFFVDKVLPKIAKAKQAAAIDDFIDLLAASPIVMNSTAGVEVIEFLTDSGVLNGITNKRTLNALNLRIQHLHRRAIVVNSMRVDDRLDIRELRDVRLAGDVIFEDRTGSASVKKVTPDMFPKKYLTADGRLRLHNKRVVVSQKNGTVTVRVHERYPKGGESNPRVAKLETSSAESAAYLFDLLSKAPKKGYTAAETGQKAKKSERTGNKLTARQVRPALNLLVSLGLVEASSDGRYKLTPFAVRDFDVIREAVADTLSEAKPDSYDIIVAWHNVSVLTGVIRPNEKLSDLLTDRLANEMGDDFYGEEGQKKAFRLVYALEHPEVVSVGKGRFNGDGAHSDWTGHYVIGAATLWGTYVTAAKRLTRNGDTPTIRIYAQNMDRGARYIEVPIPAKGEFDGYPKMIDGKANPYSWANYPVAVLNELAKLGKLDRNQSIDFYISGNLPMGTGLSSSASVKTATAFATLRVGGLKLADSDEANRLLMGALTQRAENDPKFAGVSSGALDELASLLGEDEGYVVLDLAFGIEKVLGRVKYPLSSQNMTTIIVRTATERELASEGVPAEGLPSFMQGLSWFNLRVQHYWTAYQLMSNMPVLNGKTLPVRDDAKMTLVGSPQEYEQAAANMPAQYVQVGVPPKGVEFLSPANVAKMIREGKKDEIVPVMLRDTTKGMQRDQYKYLGSITLAEYERNKKLLGDIGSTEDPVRLGRYILGAQNRIKLSLEVLNGTIHDDDKAADRENLIGYITKVANDYDAIANKLDGNKRVQEELRGLVGQYRAVISKLQKNDLADPLNDKDMVLAKGVLGLLAWESKRDNFKGDHETGLLDTTDRYMRLLNALVGVKPAGKFWHVGTEAPGAGYKGQMVGHIGIDALPYYYAMITGKRLADPNSNYYDLLAKDKAKNREKSDVAPEEFASWGLTPDVLAAFGLPNAPFTPYAQIERFRTEAGMGMGKGQKAPDLVVAVPSFGGKITWWQGKKPGESDSAIESGVGARVEKRQREALPQKIQLQLETIQAVLPDILIKAGELMTNARQTAVGTDSIADKQVGYLEGDVVTKTDGDVQTLILDELQNKIRFSYGVVAEESAGPLGERLDAINAAAAASGTQLRIIIDPIDGTAQFMNPASNRFGTIVAVEYDGDIIGGMFMAPEYFGPGHGVIFEGSELDLGVYAREFRNGVLSENMIDVRMDAEMTEAAPSEMAMYRTNPSEFGYATEDGVVTRFTSTGLILAEMAAGLKGALSVYADQNTFYWDVPLAYLVEKAGGVAVDFDGNDFFPVRLDEQGKVSSLIAGPKTVVEKLLDRRAAAAVSGEAETSAQAEAESSEDRQPETEGARTTVGSKTYETTASTRVIHVNEGVAPAYPDASSVTRDTMIALFESGAIGKGDGNKIDEITAQAMNAAAEKYARENGLHIFTVNREGDKDDAGSDEMVKTEFGDAAGKPVAMTADNADGTKNAAKFDVSQPVSRLNEGVLSAVFALAEPADMIELPDTMRALALSYNDSGKNVQFDLSNVDPASGGLERALTQLIDDYARAFGYRYDQITIHIMGGTTFNRQDPAWKPHRHQYLYDTLSGKIGMHRERLNISTFGSGSITPMLQSAATPGHIYINIAGSTETIMTAQATVNLKSKGAQTYLIPVSENAFHDVAPDPSAPGRYLVTATRSRTNMDNRFKFSKRDEEALRALRKPGTNEPYYSEADIRKILDGRMMFSIADGTLKPAEMWQTFGLPSDNAFVDRNGDSIAIDVMPPTDPAKMRFKTLRLTKAGLQIDENSVDLIAGARTDAVEKTASGARIVTAEGVLEVPDDMSKPKLVQWILDYLERPENRNANQPRRIAIMALMTFEGYLSDLFSKAEPTAEEQAAAKELAEKALPMLIANFREPGGVKAWIANLLGAFHGQAGAAIPTLRNAVLDPKENDRYRHAAIQALFHIGDQSPETVEMYKKALNDEHLYVRNFAAKALGQLREPDDSVIYALIRSLGDTDVVVAGSTRQALSKLGAVYSDTAGILTDDLSNSYRSTPSLDPVERQRRAYIRLGLAEALGNIGEAAGESVPVLVEHLNDENYYVRRNAAKALGQIGYADEAAAKALTAMALADRPEGIDGIDDAGIEQLRLNAIEALGLMRVNRLATIDALIGILDDTTNNAPLRAAAALALGRIGSYNDRAMNSLIGSGLSASEAISAASVQAIALIANAHQEKAGGIGMRLKDIFTNSSQPESVRAGVAAVWGRMPANPAFTEELRKALRDRKGMPAKIRNAAAGSINDVQELTAAALLDPSSEVQKTAIQSLSLRMTPDTIRTIVDTLVKVLKNSENPDVLIATARALEKAGPTASPAAEALVEKLLRHPTNGIGQSAKDALIAIGQAASVAVTRQNIDLQEPAAQALLLATINELRAAERAAKLRGTPISRPSVDLARLISSAETPEDLKGAVRVFVAEVFTAAMTEPQMEELVNAMLDAIEANPNILAHKGRFAGRGAEAAVFFVTTYYADILLKVMGNKDRRARLFNRMEILRNTAQRLKSFEYSVNGRTSDLRGFHGVRMTGDVRIVNNAGDAAAETLAAILTPEFRKANPDWDKWLRLGIHNQRVTIWRDGETPRVDVQPYWELADRRLDAIRLSYADGSAAKVFDWILTQTAPVTTEAVSAANGGVDVAATLDLLEQMGLVMRDGDNWAIRSMSMPNPNQPYSGVRDHAGHIIEILGENLSVTNPGIHAIQHAQYQLNHLAGFEDQAIGVMRVRASREGFEPDLRFIAHDVDGNILFTNVTQDTGFTWMYNLFVLGRTDLLDSVLALKNPELPDTEPGMKYQGDKRKGTGLYGPEIQLVGGTFKHEAGVTVVPERLRRESERKWLDEIANEKVVNGASFHNSVMGSPAIRSMMKLYDLWELTTNNPSSPAHDPKRTQESLILEVMRHPNVHLDKDPERVKRIEALIEEAKSLEGNAKRDKLSYAYLLIMEHVFVNFSKKHLVAFNLVETVENSEYMIQRYHEVLVPETDLMTKGKGAQIFSTGTLRLLGEKYQEAQFAAAGLDIETVYVKDDNNGVDVPPVVRKWPDGSMQKTEDKGVHLKLMAANRGLEPHQVAHTGDGGSDQSAAHDFLKNPLQATDDGVATGLAWWETGGKGLEFKGKALTQAGSTYLMRANNPDGTKRGYQVSDIEFLVRDAMPSALRERVAEAFAKPIEQMTLTNLRNLISGAQFVRYTNGADDVFDVVVESNGEERTYRVYTATPDVRVEWIDEDSVVGATTLDPNFLIMSPLEGEARQKVIDYRHAKLIEQLEWAVEFIPQYPFDASQGARTGSPNLNSAILAGALALSSPFLPTSADVAVAQAPAVVRAETSDGRFVGITENGNVSGIVRMSISPAFKGTVRDVTYYVDRTRTLQTSTPPFTLELDTRKLKDGDHTIGGKVKFNKSDEFDFAYTIKVKNGDKPAAEEPKVEKPADAPVTADGNFTGIKEGAELKGVVNIEISEKSTLKLESVTYVLEGVKTSPSYRIYPFTLKFDTTKVENGPYKITIKTKALDGKTSETAYNFTVKNEAPKPAVKQAPLDMRGYVLAAKDLYVSRTKVLVLGSAASEYLEFDRIARRVNAFKSEADPKNAAAVRYTPAGVFTKADDLDGYIATLGVVERRIKNAMRAEELTRENRASLQAMLTSVEKEALEAAAAKAEKKKADAAKPAAEAPKGSRVSPSLLAVVDASMGELEAREKLVEGAKKAVEAGVPSLHFDVVGPKSRIVRTENPTVTTGILTPANLAAVKQAVPGIPVDVHLMIEGDSSLGQNDPLRVAIREYAAAGADSIAIHFEAYPNAYEVENTLQEISSVEGGFVQPALAFNPDANGAMIAYFLSGGKIPQNLYVLGMSVQPGAGGQKFNPATLDKMAYISRDLADQGKTAFPYHIDGGINPETAKTVRDRAAENGFNVISMVAGSAFFKAKGADTVGDLSATLETLSQETPSGARSGKASKRAKEIAEMTQSELTEEAILELVQNERSSVRITRREGSWGWKFEYDIEILGTGVHLSTSTIRHAEPQNGDYSLYIRRSVNGKPAGEVAYNPGRSVASGAFNRGGSMVASFMEAIDAVKPDAGRNTPDRDFVPPVTIQELPALRGNVAKEFGGAEAAERIAQLGPEAAAAIPDLVAAIPATKKFKHNSVYNLIRILAAIRAIGPEAVQAAKGELLTLMRSKNESGNVWREAAETLGSLGMRDAAVEKALLDLSQDETVLKRTRDTAAAALLKVQGDVFVDDGKELRTVAPVQMKIRNGLHAGPARGLANLLNTLPGALSFEINGNPIQRDGNSRFTDAFQLIAAKASQPGPMVSLRITDGTADERLLAFTQLKDYLEAVEPSSPAGSRGNVLSEEFVGRVTTFVGQVMTAKPLAAETRVAFAAEVPGAAAVATVRSTNAGAFVVDVAAYADGALGEEKSAGHEISKSDARQTAQTQARLATSNARAISEKVMDYKQEQSSRSRGLASVEKRQDGRPYVASISLDIFDRSVPASDPFFERYLAEMAMLNLTKGHVTFEGGTAEQLQAAQALVDRITADPKLSRGLAGRLVTPQTAPENAFYVKIHADDTTADTAPSTNAVHFKMRKVTADSIAQGQFVPVDAIADIMAGVGLSVKVELDSQTGAVILDASSIPDGVVGAMNGFISLTGGKERFTAEHIVEILAGKRAFAFGAMKIDFDAVGRFWNLMQTVDLFA